MAELNSEAESGGLCWNVRVSDSSKDGETVKFTVITKTSSEGEDEKGVVVFREYEDFEWLYHCLTTHNNVEGVVIPPLPLKPVVTAAAAEAKSKKQLGTTKSMVGDEFARDCRNLEKFLQLVVVHPAFKKDEELKKFLTDEKAPTRAKVKKGLLNSITKAVDGVRFQGHKDIDEDFQKHRDFVDQYAAHTKECAANFTKMVNNQRRLSLSLSELSSAILTAGAIDDVSSKKLKKPFTIHSDALNSSKDSFDVMSTNDENTLGFTFDLYSRYMDSAREMLFRRTCKLVEFENATKALEKAKPKNRDHLENAKKEAEEAYNEISEIAKKEMLRFNHQRVLSLQSSLVQYAEARVTNGRDTYAVLLKLLGDLKKSELE